MKAHPLAPSLREGEKRFLGFLVVNHNVIDNQEPQTPFIGVFPVSLAHPCQADRENSS